MNRRELVLALPEGMADVALYTSNDTESQCGVLLIPDVGGPRDAVNELAVNIAKEGFAVLLPNPFFRTSRPPVFGFPRVPGDSATRQCMQELLSPLTPEVMDRNTEAYIDFLLSQPNIKPGGIGVVGFCVGGLMAFRAVAVRPEKVLIAASFHSGGLYRADGPKSAHLSLPKIRAKLYFPHAIEDNSMNTEAIAGLEKALKQWGGRYVSETYHDARHGWTLPDNSTYNRPQAERALSKLKSLLKESLQ